MKNRSRLPTYEFLTTLSTVNFQHKLFFNIC